MARRKKQFDELQEWNERFRTETGVEPVNEPEQWMAWGFQLLGKEVLNIEYTVVADLILGILSRQRDEEKRKKELTPKESIHYLARKLTEFHEWCERFRAGTGVEPVDEPEQWLAWGVELFGEGVLKFHYTVVAQLVYGNLSRKKCPPGQPRFIFAPNHKNPDIRDLAKELNLANEKSKDKRTDKQIASEFFRTKSNAKPFMDLQTLKSYERRKKRETRKKTSI